tara:strand:- start:101 stop:505 length:405 start_codon:yes stop_codon:yes gene_type:complete
MAFDDDVKITINLNELVDTRARLITQYECFAKKIVKGEFLDENDVDRIAVKLRETLTWDTLFRMVDESILEYLDINDPDKPHYGEIQPEPGREAELNKREAEAKKRKQYFEKNFEMVDLVSPAWTIQVPRRKTK